MYHLSEDEEKFRLTDVMEFHFIEMSKLIKDWKAEKLDPINNVLARWLLMLGMVDRRDGKVYDSVDERWVAKDKKAESARSGFQTRQQHICTSAERQT